MVISNIFFFISYASCVQLTHHEKYMKDVNSFC